MLTVAILLVFCWLHMLLEELAIVQDKLEKLRADRLELHRRFYGGINDIANMQVLSGRDEREITTY